MDDVAVVDASPLIILARAARIDLLRHVAARVLVPSAVEREVLARGQDDATVRALRASSWIEIAANRVASGRILAWDLGDGESAVLAIASETSRVIAVVDDLAARRCAAGLGVRVIGTPGLVARAKARQVTPLARPVLQELRASGLFLSDAIVERALREVGE